MKKESQRLLTCKICGLEFDVWTFMHFGRLKQGKLRELDETD